MGTRLPTGFVILCRTGCLCILISVLATPPVFADGGYFPETAIKTLPAIPSQQAILRFKNNEECLMIESSFEGPGRRFGWVIPLPAKPVNMEKASSGFIKTFSINLQPEITHDLSQETHTLYFFAAFSAIWVFLVLLVKPLSEFHLVALTILLFFVYLAFTVPTFGLLSRGKSKGGRDTLARTETGVKVVQKTVVGSYEIQVLTADSAGALDEWLGKNGFISLSEPSRKIVADYIQNKWCFVTAKLQREGFGLSTPHPIALTFPSAKPIYPMRLTALAGSPVYLELFVVADKRASASHLDLEVADFFSPSQSAGLTYYQRIKHPAAREFFWEGCMISKLVGRVKSRAMKKDFEINLRNAPPFRDTLYSYAGARDTALLWALGLWSFILPVSLWIKLGHLAEPGGRWYLLRQVVGPFTLLACVLWITIFLSLDKTEVQPWPRGPYRYAHVQNLSIVLADLIGKTDNFAKMDKNAAENILDQYFSAHPQTNPFTGYPVQREDSPGNFTLEQDSNGLYPRIYNQDGSPEDIRQSSSQI